MARGADDNNNNNYGPLSKYWLGRYFPLLPHLTRAGGAGEITKLRQDLASAFQAVSQDLAYDDTKSLPRVASGVASVTMQLAMDGVKSWITSLQTQINNASGGVSGEIPPSPLSADFTLVCTCPSSMTVGDVVQSDGMQESVPLVGPCNPIDITKMPAIGIVVAKASATTCTIAVGGVVSGLTGLVPGASYYVGLSGGLSTDRPEPPAGGSVYVQVVGTAVLPTTLVFWPNYRLTRLLG